MFLLTSCYEKLLFGEGWVDPNPPTEENGPGQDNTEMEDLPDEGKVVKSDIFIAAKENYNYYRIPAIIQTKKGTLLAFCEARNTQPTSIMKRPFLTFLYRAAQARIQETSISS